MEVAENEENHSKGERIRKAEEEENWSEMANNRELSINNKAASHLSDE